MPPEFRWNVAVRLLNADPALLSAFNDSLDRVIADQTIVRIFAKYGMTYVPPRP
jgi:ABC-type amino acid transport substrate-binding protein